MRLRVRIWLVVSAAAISIVGGRAAHAATATTTTGEDEPLTIASAVLADPAAPALRAPAQATPVTATFAARAPDAQRRISPFMWSLYTATIATQAFDADSTLRALGAGAYERNPLLAWAASSPLRLVTMKAGLSAAIVLAAHDLARRHRVRTVLVLVGIDAAYAAIAAHNESVARSLMR